MQERQHHLGRGGIVTFAGFGINLALGVLYSWSIFAKQLTDSWGWSTGQSSLPYAVAVAMFASVLAFGGRAQDRFGPRIVATIGGVLVGGGLLLSGLASADNVAPLVIGFGVLTGSGIALGFVSTFPAAAKWFPPKRRGLITGLVVSGFGIASVYIAPLTQYLLHQIGINSTFRLLGIAFLIVTVGLAQLLRNPPVALVARAALTSERAGSCRVGPREYDWHEMVRTRQFVLLWLMYGLTAFAGIMIIGHMAQITAEQVGVDLGFLLVAVLAVGNAAGRVAAGTLSDRWSVIRTMTLIFTLQALTMLVVGEASSAATLSVAAFVIGFNYGADLSLFPCIVSEYYGQANQGVNYGLVFTSWGVGGVFGSMIAGFIADSTGSYDAAFTLAAAMCGVSALLTLITRPPSGTVEAVSRRGARHRAPKATAG